jgi:dinuclear metal center YbgI/SA1388 family protein
MAQLARLEKFFNSVMYYDPALNVEQIDQWCANGLQIAGKEGVNKIGFAVSANLETFKLAVKQHCDALVVHHSLGRPTHPQFDRTFVERMKFLANNHLSLFGYHFLLDSHPEIGNNVLIIKAFGAVPTAPQPDRDFPGCWAWTGAFEHSVVFKELAAKVETVFGQKAIVYPFGPAKVKKVFAGSGGGSANIRDLEDMKRDGLDLFISGETRERYQEVFREVGINYIGAGHYATERLGIQALMAKVKLEVEGVKTVWLENWNPA